MFYYYQKNEDFLKGENKFGWILIKRLIDINRECAY